MPDSKKTEKTSAKPQPLRHVKVTFPAEFPSDSVLHWISYLRGTETLTTGEMLQHTGVIFGCAGVLLQGSPPVMESLKKELPKKYAAMSNSELADLLEQGIAPQSGAAVAAFPSWLMPILMDVIRRYFGW